MHKSTQTDIKWKQKHTEQTNDLSTPQLHSPSPQGMIVIMIVIMQYVLPVIVYEFPKTLKNENKEYKLTKDKNNSPGAKMKMCVESCVNPKG